jgi:polysaccharide export outer membrane protein
VEGLQDAMLPRTFFTRELPLNALILICLFGFFLDSHSQSLDNQMLATPTLRPIIAPGTNSSVAPFSNPARPAQGVTNPDSVWVLRPNDIISMTVYQEDDLSARTTIDVNGMVMLPLLGQVNIGGLTLDHATARIQQLYDKDYLVNPQVNLVVEQFASRKFSVLGQVQRPGSFDFPQNEPMNLLEAIAISGGYTRLGAPSKVSVRRVENGSAKIYHLDADEMAKDQKEKPFEILPNDIINIGERTF